jgi:hypothetical protein
MPIGPVSPKDMGRAGRGSYGKSVSKSKMTAKRQSRPPKIENPPGKKSIARSPNKAQEMARIQASKKANQNQTQRPLTWARVEKNSKGLKENVKTGDFDRPALVFNKKGGIAPYSKNWTVTRTPVPVKPSKAGPQARKSVKKGK